MPWRSQVRAELRQKEEELRQVREVSSRQVEEHQRRVQQMSQEFEFESDVTLAQRKIEDEKAEQADRQARAKERELKMLKQGLAENERKFQMYKQEQLAEARCRMDSTLAT
jgi:ABC-type histidine transport system ATPase subunit